MLSRLVITFLPRSKRLLISCPQSPSAVILEPPKIKSDTVSTVCPSISHEVMWPDAMIFVLKLDHLLAWLSCKCFILFLVSSCLFSGWLLLKSWNWTGVRFRVHIWVRLTLKPMFFLPLSVTLLFFPWISTIISQLWLTLNFAPLDFGAFCCTSKEHLEIDPAQDSAEWGALMWINVCSY